MSTFHNELTIEKNNELLNGVSWHLECMMLASVAIDNFRPPADCFQVRMHHSLYLTNLMSTIDMLREIYGPPFLVELEEGLKTVNLSGRKVLSYLRELRNGIVHRGTDPTHGGVVIDGVICALAPPTVQNRDNTRSYAAPAKLLREVFAHCELGAKPPIKRFLEPSLEVLTSTKPEVMLNDVLNAINTVEHMPNWAKEMAHKQTTSDMLVEARTRQVEKLQNLLKPRIRQGEVGDLP